MFVFCGPRAKPVKLISYVLLPCRRKIVSVVPPSPGDCEAFEAIDEDGFEEYRKSNEGGCSCGAEGRCESARCRKCWGQGLPCTGRCKCKGACGNPHPIPLPECLIGMPEEEIRRLTLADIVRMLTPRDIEFWALKHGRFGHYWLQFKLCARADAPGCWYCSRFGVRQLPNLEWFPLTTISDEEGGWMSLHQRVELMQAKDPRASQFLSSDSLPSFILRNAFNTSRQLTRDRLEELVKLTNLKAESILQIFKKWADVEDRAQAADASLED